MILTLTALSPLTETISSLTECRYHTPAPPTFVFNDFNVYSPLATLAVAVAVLVVLAVAVAVLVVRAVAVAVLVDRKRGYKRENIDFS